MAERVSLTLSLPLPSQQSPTRMAAFGGGVTSVSSRFFSAASRASVSLVSSSRSPSFFSSSSSSLSSLNCFGSSRRISHLFLHQRRVEVRVLTGGYITVSASKAFASDSDQLKSAREDIKQLLSTKSCHPILIRLGWHDAGTYNENIEEWPQRGGANGSLRFEVELKHAANAGLINALNLLKPIKDKHSGVTYADLFQLASATTVEEAGGPKNPYEIWKSGCFWT